MNYTFFGMKGTFSPTHHGWLPLVLVLTACASQVPPAIRQAPADNPSVEAVRENVAEYEGRQVRSG